MNEKQTEEGVPIGRVILLSRKEAAAYLGVAEQTLAIWKWSGRHKLRCVKIGRLCKYRQQDLDAFIRQNLITA